MKRVYFIGALAFVLLTHMYGQKFNPNIAIGGFVETDHISYFENTHGKINGRNQAVFQLEVESKLNENASFFSATEFRDDFSDMSRRRVYLDETFIDMSYQFMDIRIGKQIFTWGKADEINPTNTINPVDYTDIIDTEDETMGVFALNTNFYLRSWKLQGIFVPVFTPSKLPSNNNSRWYTNIEIPALPVPSYSVTLNAPHEPKNDIRGNQFAFALSTSFRSWDFTTSFYNGFSHLPELERDFQLINGDSAVVTLTPKYYELMVLGGNFSTVLGNYGLRGEAGYYLPNGIENDRSYWRYVMGIDRNFSNIIGYNNLFVIVQWIHEIAEGGYEFSNLELNHLFQESIMARLQYDLGILGTLKLQGIYNLDSDNYYFSPEVEFNAFDGLNIVLVVDIMGGRKGGFFYQYQDNNRLQFKVKYSF